MSDPSSVKSLARYKTLSEKDKRLFWLRQVILPATSTILIFVAGESIKDKPTLFLTIFLISVSFVLASYAILKFQPLKSSDGRKRLFAKLIFVTTNSIIYTLSIVVILTTFLYGTDIPAFTFDYQTQVLSIYMQKIYVYFFIYVVTWAISNFVTKLVIH